RTRFIKDDLLQGVEAARGVIDPFVVSGLRRAITDYYEAAYGVSHRLITGEIGVTLVADMSMMQAKQARVDLLLKEALTLDRSKLLEAFSSIEESQRTSSRAALLISSLCLSTVLLLAAFLSRGFLHSLNALSFGLKRFGQGDFSEAIAVSTR